MRVSQLLVFGYAIAFLMAAGMNGLLCAAEEPEPGKRRNEDLREQLKKMSPAERDAKLKEVREKYNQPRPERALAEKRREEIKKLSSAERQAKLREWRAGDSNAPMAALSADERKAKRKELRARLQAQLDNVKTNTQLDLSPEQRKVFIRRMQEVAKTFDRSPEAQNTPAEK